MVFLIRSWKIRQEKDGIQGGRIPVLGKFWNASTTVTICSVETKQVKTKENHLQTGTGGGGVALSAQFSLF